MVRNYHPVLVGKCPGRHRSFALILEDSDSPMVIYTHSIEGLDGKIPAEACGFVVNGEKKWITLNAARVK